MQIIINGNKSEEISQQSVQSYIMSNYTYTLDIKGGRYDSLKIYSIDAVCELVKMACELAGLNKRNNEIYNYVCKFQQKAVNLYEELKITQSIMMDSVSNTFEYQVANRQATKITKKFNDFRNKIITYAWNAKLAYSM